MFIDRVFYLFRILMPLILMVMLLTGCVWYRSLEFVPEQNDTETSVGGWSIKAKCPAYYKLTKKQLAGHENIFSFDIEADYRRPDSGAYMNDLVIDSVRTRVGGSGDQIMWSVTSTSFAFYGSDWPITKLTEAKRTDETGGYALEIPPHVDSLLIDFYVTITPGKHALFPVSGYQRMLSDWVVVPAGAVGRQEVVTATLVRKESKSLFFGL